MTLADALSRIEKMMQKMNAAYRRPVFDEWAIVKLDSNQDSIIHIDSPRGTEVAKEFGHDFRLLREEAQDQDQSAGDFSFTRSGTGSTIDAYLVLGSGCVLVCNHTELSIDEITKDPLWKKAQAAFVSLSESLVMDPLTL